MFPIVVKTPNLEQTVEVATPEDIRHRYGTMLVRQRLKVK